MSRTTSRQTRPVFEWQAKGGCNKGWLWAYGRPHDQVYFDFRPSRSRDGPEEILEGFSGKLQTDGYGAYSSEFGEGELLHFSSWAHARRYFVDAKEKSKRVGHSPGADGKSRAQPFIAMGIETPRRPPEHSLFRRSPATAVS